MKFNINGELSFLDGKPVIKVDDIHIESAPLPEPEPKPQSVFRFDFGTETSPVASGYTKVTENSLYAPEIGYGWISGNLKSGDRGVEDSDFVYATDATFQVDLPNGTYPVGVSLYDPKYTHDNIGIIIQGSLVDTVSTVKTEPVIGNYVANVVDGKLLVQFKDLGGSDPNFVANSLVVGTNILVPEPEPEPEPEPTPEPSPKPEPDPNDTSAANAHFNSMLSHPAIVKSWTLRRPEDYTSTRGGIVSENRCITYDATKDAAKVTLPPLSNELVSGGTLMLYWNEFGDFNVGDKLVVQHDFMISAGMRLYTSAVGLNGRKTDDFKFTNLCRGKQITYELRTHFIGAEDSTETDFRGYCSKYEGRTDRDEFACQASDPSRTYSGSGGGTESHPGPDSTRIYGKDEPYPTEFKYLNDTWVRVTYEVERTGPQTIIKDGVEVEIAGGSRLKVWLADENYGPILIVSSPIDPNKGFLNSIMSLCTSLYVELDTSQETSYAEPQPDRSCWFRNVLVFKNINGEDVLGGRPIR